MQSSLLKLEEIVIKMILRLPYKQTRMMKKIGQANNNYEAMVSIKDTGIGIDPEIFPRLFTKFATAYDKGIGLGLFISKSIVEAHNDRMWAENYSSDGQKGAVFYFTITLKAK
jgi:signal transduction histidine kinase